VKPEQRRLAALCVVAGILLASSSFLLYKYRIEPEPVFRAQPSAAASGTFNSDDFQKHAALLESANVSLDVRDAIRSNDFRFLGVKGYGLSAPGVTSYAYVEKFGIKAIDGTSDVLHNAAQMRLQSVAKRYAREYNQLMEIYLSGLPKQEHLVQPEK
jgi:hypothetical protein